MLLYTVLSSLWFVGLLVKRSGAGREKRNAKRRKNYAKDPEQKKKREQEKYAKNPEPKKRAMKKRAQEKYEEEPEQKKKREWEKYAEDPEQKKKREREKYAEDPELKKKREREKYAEDPESKKRAMNKYHAEHGDEINAKKRKETDEKYINMNMDRADFSMTVGEMPLDTTGYENVSSPETAVMNWHMISSDGWRFELDLEGYLENVDLEEHRK